MISTNTSTDHLFPVLARNYWETQGGIWGPVLRDLPGNVNETHNRIYFRIYLLGVECSGAWALLNWRWKEKVGRREAEGEREGQGSSEKPPIKQLHKRRLLPLLQGCIRLPSYCQVDKRRKKINQKPNQINVQLINSAAKNLPLRDHSNAPWKAPPSCPHKGEW